ncbi:MAG: AbrB family transcriptional regulator [Actinomycetota bacterium]|nr:AbrB family transcriptional regulator [Actinomycetota bacterium]
MKLLITLAAVFAGAFLLDRLRLPAGALLGGALGAGLVNTLYAQGVSNVAPTVRFVAFALLGWAIGSTISRQSLGALRDHALLLGAAILVLLAFSGLLAVILTKVGGLDPMTSYLATSPGALSQMTVMAGDLGADPLIVISVHTTRVIIVLLSAPIITRLLQSATT